MPREPSIQTGSKVQAGRSYYIHVEYIMHIIIIVLVAISIAPYTYMYMYDNAGGNVVATNCFSKIESDIDHNMGFLACPKL